MTYSYTNTLPTKRDQVRFLAQDNRGAPTARLQDEELDWILTQHGNVYLAASQAADAIAAQWADRVDKTVGALRLAASQRFDHYTALAERLATQASEGGMVLPKPYAGGVSQADVDGRKADTDRPKRDFERGMMDARPDSTGPWPRVLPFGQ